MKITWLYSYLNELKIQDFTSFFFLFTFCFSFFFWVERGVLFKPNILGLLVLQPCQHHPPHLENKGNKLQILVKTWNSMIVYIKARVNGCK